MALSNPAIKKALLSLPLFRRWSNRSSRSPRTVPGFGVRAEAVAAVAARVAGLVAAMAPMVGTIGRRRKTSRWPCTRCRPAQFRRPTKKSPLCLSEKTPSTESRTIETYEGVVDYPGGQRIVSTWWLCHYIISQKDSAWKCYYACKSLHSWKTLMLGNTSRAYCTLSPFVFSSKSLAFIWKGKFVVDKFLL